MKDNGKEGHEELFNHLLETKARITELTMSTMTVELLMPLGLTGVTTGSRGVLDCSTCSIILVLLIHLRRDFFSPFTEIPLTHKPVTINKKNTSGYH